MATPTIQIDPNTGERIGDAAPIQTGAVQIDPNTGERVTPTPPIAAQPGNAWTSGHPLDTLRANYDEAMRPYTPQEVEDNGAGSTILHGIGRGFTGTLLTPLLHPLDTLKGIGKMAVNPVGAGEDMGNAAIQDFKNNGTIQALPNLLGQAGAAMIGGKLMGGPATKTLPSLTTPEEAAADQFTKAVGPPKADAAEFSNNVRRHLGDLNDYAEQTNNPLAVSKDYVKAAHGAGDEALAHYKEQILNPVGYRTQPIPPEYQGVQSESVPGTASLNNIDSRVTDINAEEKLLRGSGGDLAARQRLLGLGAEKAKLLDILHQSLSDLSGKNADGSPAITPEQVQALRQKGPSLKDIGDTINSTDYSRLVAPELNTATGGKINMGVKLFDKYVRGGPQAIADKAMGKVAKSAPMGATPLPVPGSTPTSLPPLNTEYLHLNNLEQAAQDASAQRATQAAQLRAERAASFGKDARAATAVNAQRVGLPPLNTPDFSVPPPNPAAQVAIRARYAQQQAAAAAASQAQAVADAQALAQRKAFGEAARAKAAENSNRR